MKSDDVENSCVVENDLIQKACKTHYPSPIASSSLLTNADKILHIADKFRAIMEILGLDLNNDSLQQTPLRIAKMYVEEIFSGLDCTTFPEISFFENPFQGETQHNMVFVKVSFCSFCEHHFVPMNGTACVAYLPEGKLLGFSKIPQIVRFFAKRPQVQERLTAQIADAISILTGSKHVAVSLCAEHYCMIARGIECENSHAITNVLLGDFTQNSGLHKEFFEAINRKT